MISSIINSSNKASSYIEKHPYAEVSLLIIAYFLCLKTGVIGDLIPTILAAIPFFFYMYLLLPRIKQMDVSKAFIIIILFAFVLVLSTVINGGQVRSAVGSLMGCLSMTAIFECYRVKSSFLPIKIYAILGYFLIALDLLTIVAFPAGIGEVGPSAAAWFLGYKSYRIYLAIPTIAFIYLWCNEEHLDPRIYYSLIVISLVSAMLSKATMGFACLLLMAVGIVLMDVRHHRSLETASKVALQRLLEFKIWIAAFIAIGFLVVAFAHSSELLQAVLSLFGKSSTLSGRTIIWEKTIDMWLENPVLGFGYIAPSSFADIIGFDAATTPHSFYLAVLGYSGIIGFVLLGVVLWKCMRRYRPGKMTKSDVVALAIAVELFLGITSVNLFSMFTIPLLILFDTCLAKESKAN